MSDSISQYRGDFGGGQCSATSPNLGDAQPEVSSENVNIGVEKNMEGEGEEEHVEEDGLPTSRKRKFASRSKYWIHFVKYYCETEKIQMAKCKYCKRDIKADSKAQGTRPLKNHYNCCKKRPPNFEIDANQTQLAFEINVEGTSKSPGTSSSHVSSSSSSPFESSKNSMNEVSGDHLMPRKVSLQQEFRMYKTGGKPMPTYSSSPNSSITKARLYLEKTSTSEESDRVSRLTFPAHLESSFYEYFVLRGIRLDRFQPGSISCSFKVPPRLTDRNGNLGMGAIATLIDEIGAAVIHEVGQPMDVSVDMSISCLSAAKMNDELEIISRCLGKRGGYSGTNVLIRNKTTGEVVAEGRHSLFTKPTSKI
ncbi:hypothetical protein BUALT_Bualt02G0070800 [Buddleja alternifolia]|uniref:Acyl-coenzyme A thioesterase 13 n=1 Tax=Buddleja alternifolia TaxID=168488 RepID=A0AAV6Y0A7_9LAMI|nr:hypothetical protein BUALT_Bualt02G0070800 [Buddleja alternifolia]